MFLRVIIWNEILKRMDKSKTLEDAVKLWGGSLNSLCLVNEGINLVYRFEQNGKGYYLRLTHESLRNKHELQAAIAYQHHLFTHDVPICAPIQSVN